MSYHFEAIIENLTDEQLRKVVALLLEKLNMKVIEERTPDYVAFEIVEVKNEQSE